MDGWSNSLAQSMCCQRQLDLGRGRRYLLKFSLRCVPHHGNDGRTTEGEAVALHVTRRSQFTSHYLGVSLNSNLQ